jgi:hypothetical protein
MIHLEQRSASQPMQLKKKDHLVHEDLDASVQAFCDRIIE